MPDVGERQGSSIVAAKRAVETSAQGVPSTSRTRRGGILSAAAILSRIDTAKRLHSTRDGMMDDVEDKLKRQYKKQEKDVVNTKTPLIKTPRAEAIIDLFNALLTTTAELGTQVLPLKSGDQEDRLCTKLEQGLAGIQFEIESWTGKTPFPAGVWWFLARGWGIWKTDYNPHDSALPITIEAPDPRGIYPVEGDRLMYVVEERKKYAGELRRNIKALKWKGRGRVSWKAPNLKDYPDIETVLLTQYQDEECQALLIDGDFVYRRRNMLGFIPYGISKCRFTPDADPAWAGQSILAPILALLELETDLLSKFGVGLDLFFYPRILVKKPDGSTVILRGAPGEFEGIDPEAEIIVLTITSNVQEALNLLAQVQSLMSLLTMPEVLSGVPPGQVQAGYPMALLMNAAKSRLAREIGQLEFGMGKTQEHVLRIADKFGGLNGGIPIYVQPEEGKRGRKALVTLTDKDVQGHFRVKVTLATKMPQDYLQMMPVIDRMRKEGVDGQPLMSDRWMREELLSIGAPEEEAQRIFDQKMMGHPEVMRHRMKKWLEDWRKKEKIKPPEEQKPEELDVSQLIPAAMEDLAAQGMPGQGPPGVPGGMEGGPPTPPGGAPLEEQLMRQMMPPGRG